MRTYIVNVPKLRFGKGTDDVALKGETVDLNDNSASRLLKKGYITFESASKKKAVPTDNKKTSESTTKKNDAKQGDVNIDFNPDDVIDDKKGKKGGK